MADVIANLAWAHTSRNVTEAIRGTMIRTGVGGIVGCATTVIRVDAHLHLLNGLRTETPRRIEDHRESGSAVSALDSVR